MPRPYIQKSIIELKALFDSSRNDGVELKKIAAELHHRQRQKALTLRKEVLKAIEVLKGDSAPQQQRDGREEKSTQPIFECENCRQKLKLSLREETIQYRCPDCHTPFSASFRNGVLSVVFSKIPPSGMSKGEEDGAPLTLDEAYKLFEANEGTPWEIIEKTRRRLIQQYHPDKVAALGPKLRDVAATEGKRINVAFDMLRKTHKV